MDKTRWRILGMVLVLCAGAAGANPPAFEYPSALLDAYDADGSCWTGMDAVGTFPVRVVPEQWLIGPPPSADSAVTLPTDHWLDVAFSGRLAGGDGNDLFLTETGSAGEQALLFITDGADQEYLLAELTAGTSSQQNLSYFGIDLDSVTLPFVARAVRVVALDQGGQSPGFDLNGVIARVSHEGGTKASYPNPVCGATGVRPDARLTWSPGSGADGHVVYFSVDAASVAGGADGVRYPPQAGEADVFVPPTLPLGRTCYWRVDESGDQGVGPLTPGDVWSFTVADRVTLEDFEAYDLREHFLYEAWRIRGRADASLEQGIAASCGQSLAFRYQYDAAWPSEIVRTFAQPQNWARMEAQVVQFSLRGTPGNATTGQMYLTLGDGRTEQQVPYPGDLHVLVDPRWHTCRIALSEFTGIDLTRVTSIALGLRCVTTDPQEHGRGTIYLDDITLRPGSSPGTPDPASGAADLSADGAVDYRDLRLLAQNWLDDFACVPALAEPNQPVLWYDFDGSAADQAGTADGEIRGRCSFVPGVYGQAIRFASEGDSVMVPEAAEVFRGIRSAVTVAFWQRGDDSTHVNDTICCSNYVYGQANPSLAIHLGCWRDPGVYRWDCGTPWSFANRLAGRHGSKDEWTGRWNHWAFTKDARRGRMEIYRNGVLYDSRTGADATVTGITSFEIGSGWYGRYDGALDDFRIYDYALSATEIAYVATRGTGVLPEPPNSPADLNADGIVDFRDFALLAAQWLAGQPVAQNTSAVR